MYRWVPVELVHLGHKLLLGRVRGHADGHGLHPKGFTHLPLLPDVYLRCGILPDEYDCESGRHAPGFESIDPLSELSVNLLGHFLTEDELGRHLVTCPFDACIHIYYILEGGTDGPSYIIMYP